MNTTLLILAGGASSRMKQSVAVEGLSTDEVAAANTKNKALIHYGSENRPILDYLLLHAEKAGYTQIYLITGEQALPFKSYYGSKATNNSFRSLSLSYATQYIPKGRSKPLGTADAVFQALEQYPHLQNTSFTVCNCDNLYSVKALRALVHTNAYNACIAYDRDGLQFSNERISRFALMELNSNNYLTNIIEKPERTTANKYRDSQGALRVSMNLFKLDGNSMFPYLKNCPIHPIRNEKELPTALLKYCNDVPNTLKAIPFKEHVPDLTSKEDIITFKKYLKTLE